MELFGWNIDKTIVFSTILARRRAAEGKRRKKTEEEELAGETGFELYSQLKFNKCGYRQGNMTEHCYSDTADASQGVGLSLQHSLPSAMRY